MVDYQGNWLPGGGQVRSFTPRKGQGLTQDLFYSSNLGALLSTRTLVKGDSYSVNVVTVPTYSDAQLSKRRFGKVANGTDTNVPAVVATRLRELWVTLTARWLVRAPWPLNTMMRLLL